MELQDRVCIVTGGGSGIGAATCRAFAREGAKVIVSDIREAEARTVADEIGAIAIACDVADESQVNSLVAETEDKLGKVDLFFNNAGVFTGGNPLTTPIDVWQRQWNINVMAHVFAVRALLPKMLERGEGYLVHTASMAGILSAHGNLTYATTKHAVVGLAEWLAFTYHNKGIRVSLLAPLGVRTPMLEDLVSPSAIASAGPIKEPEEVADMVVQALREERFLILTDPIAQTWMERKATDPERWLNGMRRLQIKLESAGSGEQTGDRHE